ncbi:RDD family protein [Thiohalocapsa halophila]|uniref:RDD family protein n=1 Tax=Thiohalocapsa halophila TaxID=69359 RepID=A0ABS1CNH3_9GAMM|nr:RDD family protein [Thiohalocapsa halophila]MBK1633445.1 RDD family protein [Thiohalocapsa halophila]
MQEPQPQPADQPAAGAIDTLRRFETPEGVEIALRLAGPVPRALAFAIDFAIRAGLYLLLLPLAGLAGVGVGLLLLALFLLEWLYPVLFELRSGATPGKRAMGLLVVHADGTPVGPSASLLRNLLRAADFLPVLYGLGLAAMLADRDFRRLGDLAAGTLVIHRDAPPLPAALPVHPPLPPPAPLDLATQQAVLAFAERSRTLSPARQAELAALAGLTTAPGADPVAALLGIANWISRGNTADAAAPLPAHADVEDPAQAP